MPAALKFSFTGFVRPQGVLVVFCGENLQMGAATQRMLGPVGDLLRRAAAADRFTGKLASSLDIIAPTGLDVPRLVVIGIGKEADLKPRDIVRLGGVAAGKIPSTSANATIFAEFPSGALKPAQVGALALGARLRRYSFDLYKTKPKEGEETPKKAEINFACSNAASAEKAWGNSGAVADGVVFARDPHQ